MRGDLAWRIQVVTSRVTWLYDVAMYVDYKAMYHYHKATEKPYKEIMGACIICEYYSLW